jgi:conjugal transfer ATP-binding protein TraC
MDFRHKYPQIGPRFGACLNMKDLPDDIDPMVTNQCFGGVMGMQDDANQLNFPFLYTLNIIYDRSVNSEVSHKASLTMGQKSMGNFSYAIGLRVREFSRVLGDLAKNKRYLKIIPVLWVFGDSRKQVSKRVSRAVTVWEKRSFKLQQETVLNKVLLISALPGGLYNFRDNINIIDRHYYASSSGIARMLPVQGDYQGNGSPVMLLVGRKGQLIGLDVYAEGSNNHNLLVGAESGAGKSFILNTMLSDYADAGEKVRVVDIGYSYKKLCWTKGGKFIDLGDPNERHCINPFWFKTNDLEDMKYNLEAAINVVAEMVYSASGSQMRETEWTLLKTATDHVVSTGNYLNAVTEIRNWLRDYDLHEKDSPDYIPEISRIAKEMAFNLRDFCLGGKWGHFFNGQATLNIANDDFVVVELETLKSQRELFSVVVMQVMNAITQDLYLSDRMSRRFILFEEAPALLRKSGHNDLSRLAAMIEEGYRRARKYGGSFGVVMQSLLDLKLMGDTGQVIMDNAAYKFMLQSKSFAKAAEEKIVNLQGFALELAESVKNNKPKYSEILFETPQGLGVGRLVVDNWRYWVNTTSADEVGRFEALLKQGKTPYEAIAELSGMGVTYGTEE